VTARKQSKKPRVSGVQDGQREKSAGKPIPVRVRPIKTSDFDFIRDLASRSAGYTVPTPYVLWMLTTFQREFCAVANARGYGNLGYLLVSPVGVRSDRVFVWQLACTFRGQRLRAPDALAEHLKRTARKYGVRRICFTSRPNSPQGRFVRSLAERVFHVQPALGKRLPGQISGESEYTLTLPQGRSSE
jgi:hypothetical protein